MIKKPSVNELKNCHDPAPDMVLIEKEGTAKKRKGNHVSASIKTGKVVKHEQMLPVCSPNGNSSLCISTNKYRIIHLKQFNLSNMTVEIIKQLPHANLQLIQGKFTEMELETTLAARLKQMDVESTNLPSEEENWGAYMPPVEGRPISIWNNTMQVTHRSLPYISVSIKHKSVPAVIDPSVSLSFICNDLYNIYVQSNYSEEEICYSEISGRKRKTAYCWWSQRRAVVERATITLPIMWGTVEGGVQDVIKLNVIEPNPGLINGYIVLGRDFYAKYVPSFYLMRNLISVNVGSKRNSPVRMQTYWFTVTDYIPIVDRRKGVVYFIDKYEKNHKYRRKRCYSKGGAD